MNEIIFDICRILATIAGLIVACYVVPALKALIRRYVDDDITGFINSAVYAAQQTLSDNNMKKKYVLKVVREWLESHKITITDEQLEILIESAVLAMKTDTAK
jgi:hypothetical protein